MNALASLGGAFVSICHPTSLLLMAAGVAVGIIFGSIPGLSAAMAVALFLPLTFSMTPSMGMNLLVAVYIGGISGGLISAILLNMPGTASSIATCFDGHPMAKNGEAGRALGYGIVFSFLGSVFSFLVLTFCAPLLADIALKFTPAENFGISFFALTMVAVLASGSMVKGVLAGMLGLIFALVGMAPIDGTPRFTFGSSSLMAGFDTLPTLIGIFAISEILITAESMGNGKVEAMKMKPIKGFGFTWKEFVYQIPNAIRSALIGTGIGILPGIGGSTSGMLSYVTAKNMSKHPDEFGKGCPDGIVATETANNATIGGAMIPLLVLGIPGDGVTAMMLGGFLIHGLSAGPLLLSKRRCGVRYICGLHAVQSFHADNRVLWNQGICSAAQDTQAHPDASYSGSVLCGSLCHQQPYLRCTVHHPIWSRGLLISQVQTSHHALCALFPDRRDGGNLSAARYYAV